MPDIAKPALEAETIRRVASQQVGISLTANDLRALVTTLNGLLDEILLMRPIDRAGVEPESGVTVEEWPS